MQNLAQGSEVWIVAVIGFVLGLLIEWLIARSRRNSVVHRYETELLSAQRELKRTQDDLDTVQSQLEAQRDRAEILAAERANAQNELLMAEEARSGQDAKVYDLEAALGDEIERREVAEELLEQTRSQSMILQNSLDATRSELQEAATRLREESEARGAAETALAAEALRVSELAQRLETLGTELARAQAEMAAAVASQLALQRAETGPASPDLPTEPMHERSTDNDSPTDGDLDASGDGGGEDGSEDTPRQNEAVENAALEAARARVIELSESVSALSAMGAELAVELDRRDRANQVLRSQLVALGVEPDVSLDSDADSGEEGETTSPTSGAQERTQQPASDPVAVERYQRMEEELVEKTARVGELEGQLAEQSVALDGLKSDLSEAQEQVQNLSAQVDRLQGEHEVLRGKSREMEERLRNRTEEVSALTSAAVAAAATIERRDEALKQAEAQEQSLREQLAAISEARKEAETALADKEAVIADLRSMQEGMESDLSAISADRDAAVASLAEKEMELARMSDAAEAGDLLGQKSGPEPGRRQAQTRSSAEQEPALGVGTQAQNSGAAAVGPSSVKASAIRQSFSIGVTPRELAEPQDLEQLPGIGPLYRRKLNAAGIGTFWEFASCSDADLMEALGLDGTDQQRARATEARVEAFKLAEETDSVGALWRDYPSVVA